MSHRMVGTVFTVSLFPQITVEIFTGSQQRNKFGGKKIILLLYILFTYQKILQDKDQRRDR
jgi:hypothetical protein